MNLANFNADERGLQWRKLPQIQMYSNHRTTSHYWKSFEPFLIKMTLIMYLFITTFYNQCKHCSGLKDSRSSPSMFCFKNCNEATWQWQCGNMTMRQHDKMAIFQISLWHSLWPSLKLSLKQTWKENAELKQTFSFKRGVSSFFAILR